MSEIKIDKLTGTGTAGVIVVTGEGNSTTTSLQQGLAKVWVDISGSGSRSGSGIFISCSWSGNSAPLGFVSDMLQHFLSVLRQISFIINKQIQVTKYISVMFFFVVKQ